MQPECCQPHPGPDMAPGALAFHVWARPQGAQPVMRRLGMRSDQQDLYSFAWLKSVQAIEFDGRFTPMFVGPLPMQCAATCRASVSVQEMAVQAALTGDRELVKLAVLHDPLTAAVCTTD